LATTVRKGQPIALAAGLAFLLGTRGGVSTLIACLVTPELRVWNPISIFIAFCSLLAIGPVRHSDGPPHRATTR